MISPSRRSAGGAQFGRRTTSSSYMWRCLLWHFDELSTLADKTCHHALVGTAAPVITWGTRKSSVTPLLKSDSTEIRPTSVGYGLKRTATAALLQARHPSEAHIENTRAPIHQPSIERTHLARRGETPHWGLSELLHHQAHRDVPAGGDLGGVRIRRPHTRWPSPRSVSHQGCAHA